MTQDFEPTMLTPQQAAQRIGKSIWTIRYWLKKGLRHTRPGGTGHIVIRSDDLDAFVNKQGENAQSTESRGN